MKRWHSRTWRVKKGEEELWHGGMAGYVDPGSFAAGIFPNDDFSALFTYMFRRFGVSEHGSDDYKEIACWFLTTPDPAVVLIVSPRPSGLRYSFGYLVNTSVYSEWIRDDGKEAKAEAAVKEAMRDLLIPTNVRDEYINATGKVKDEDIGRITVPYFKWAGCGVTADYFRKLSAPSQPEKENKGV